MSAWWQGTLSALALLGLAPPWASAQADPAEAPTAAVEEAAGEEPAGEEADDSQEKATLERFLGVLRKNPRRGTALDRVYGHHVERGTLDGFLAELRQTAEANASDGVPWLLLGLFESQRGNDAQAVEAFGKAEAALPDNALVSFYLAQSLVLVGKPDQAIEALERAIERRPSRAELLDIYQTLGRLHQRAQRSEQALATWRRLEEQFPDDPRVLEQIARALSEEGQTEQALPRFEALAKATQDPYRRTQFQLEAAQIKLRGNRSEEALADLERLLADLKPDHWLYRDVRRAIEDVFLRTDDLDGLAKYYEKWVDAHQEDLDALERLSDVLRDLGRDADARVWLEKGLARAPKRVDLRRTLIEQLTTEGKIAEALAQFEELDKQQPGDPDVIRAWGQLALQDTSHDEAQRREAAAKIWGKLVEARPNDAVVVAQLADLLRGAESEQAALDRYRQAIELAPEQAQYREYLGEYLHSLKRDDEALAAWRGMAEGPRRSVDNLRRLAEVLAGFDFHAQALEAASAAVEIKPDDFALRSTKAALLAELERTDEALQETEAAAALVESPEDAENLLRQRIEILQATNRLQGEIERLAADPQTLAAAETAYRLARLQEAAQDDEAAVAAANASLKLAPDSLKALECLARVQERRGELLAAAGAYRQLAQADRRFRSDHLTNVAKLEARLGRRKEALQAARDLIASAPGNPEHYEFLAGLCFQLGDAEQGLDALRRSLRVNPRDMRCLLALAQALAEQLRVAEATELYWRAYDEAENLDDQLAVVPKLAELYQQTNQFDRLLERLGRDRQQADRKRAAALSMAAAHQASWDLGSARQELESLLTQNTRDTQLLQMLVRLSESESDWPTAIKYQRRVTQLTDAAEEHSRLATLLLKQGENDEAVALLAELAKRDHDAARLTQAVDALRSSEQNEAALRLVEEGLRSSPDDWELLFRRGLLLPENRAEEAQRTFEALLALAVDDDESSAAAKARLRMPGATQAAAMQRNFPRGSPIEMRLNRASNEIPAAMGLGGPNYAYYAGMQRQAPFAPDDFGQARIGAMAWLLRQAERADHREEFLKERRAACDREVARAQARWDWFYLQALLQDGPGMYQAARLLAEERDAEARWTLLRSLMGRSRVSARSGRPVLPAAEIEQLVECFESVRRDRPELAASYAPTVVEELKRAGREADSDRIYRSALEAAQDAMGIMAALQLAAQRGATDDCLALTERLANLSTTASRNPFGGKAQMVVGPYTELMSQRADAKAHGELLRLFRAYCGVRQSDKASARSTAARGRRSGLMGAGMGYNFHVRLGKQQFRRVSCEFPPYNDYIDHSGVQLLRVAYELHLRDDLVSDLESGVAAWVDEAPPAEKPYALITQASLQAWAEDQELATETMLKAAESAPADASLQLVAPALYEHAGDFPKALDLVDALAPATPAQMVDREQYALRLAIRLGNVERARQGAERLFGLRLTNDVQLQLSGQMRELGLHEMADAVLARARRQSGNRLESLVQMMQAYQAQNRPELAVQAAQRIVARVAPTSRLTGRQTYDQNQGLLQAALQTLQQQGQLTQLIERAEAELKRAPGSGPALFMLRQYYAMSGQQDKSLALLEQYADARPDDAFLQWQLAQQLDQSGRHDDACNRYLAAMKREPSLFGENYWQVEQTFRQANRFNELAQHMASIDLRRMGQYYVVTNMIGNLTRGEETRELGMKLFERAWAAFPNERPYLLQNLSYTDLWQQPEVYDYIRQGFFPNESMALPSAWVGMDSTVNYSGEGRVETVLNRMVDLAVRQNRLRPLYAEVEERLQRFPDWSAGKAMLAILDARLGKLDDAQRRVEELLTNESDPMPMVPRWALGVELENYEPLHDLCERLYKAKNPEERYGGLDFNNTIERRLAGLYQSRGKVEEARTVIRAALEQPVQVDFYDQDYYQRQRAESVREGAEMLLELGAPLDALQALGSVLNDAPLSVGLRNNPYGGGDSLTGLEKLQEQTLQAIDAEALTAHFRSLSADDKARQSIDLATRPTSDDLLSARLECSFEKLLVKMSAAAPKAQALAASLSELAAAKPDDVSAATAAALATDLAAAPVEQRQAALERLLTALEKNPLEALKAGTRANARQRAAAAERLPIWLVARRALAAPETLELGQRLGREVLAAAERQQGPTIVAIVCREWGDLAWQAKRHEEAQAQWSSMLEAILAKDSRAKPGSQNALPATLTQFQQAAQIARLLLDRQAPEASFEAVRKALATGPPAPVTDVSAEALRSAQLGALRMGSATFVSGGTIYASPVRASGGVRRLNDVDMDSVGGAVGETLSELLPRWSADGVDATKRYELLTDTVFPASRPKEIFCYPASLPPNLEQPPKSVARLLVQTAHEAHALDDLAVRIEHRAGEAMAEADAHLLQGLVALQCNDAAGAEQALAWFKTRLEQQAPLQVAQLACHLGAPALERADCRATAIEVLGVAGRALQSAGRADLSQAVQNALFRQVLASGDLDSARAMLTEFLVALPATTAGMVDPNGDSNASRGRLAELLMECASAGQAELTWELLGRLADIPRGPSNVELGPGVLPALAALAKQPPTERYAALKRFTWPSEGRKSVRLLVAFVPERLAPTCFYADAPSAGAPRSRLTSDIPGVEGGVASSAEALIEAARDAGKLDELAEELKPLVAAEADNAQALATLVDLERGRLDEARPELDKVLSRARRLGGQSPNRQATPVSWADYSVARAAARRPEVRRLAFEILDELARAADHTSDEALIVHLRGDRARAAAEAAGASAAAVAATPAWRHWHSAGHTTAARHSQGHPESWWTSNSTQTFHVVGPAQESLFFAYPLTGKFRISVDAFKGAWAESDVGYGGLDVEVQHASQAFPAGHHESVTAAASNLVFRKFHGLEVSVDPERVQFLANGSSALVDDHPTTASPFFYLLTGGERRSAYRRIRLEGEPVVPREVALLEPNRMRGWISSFYGESQPPSLTREIVNPDARQIDAPPAATPTFDWRCVDGVLQGRHDTNAGDRAQASRLYFHRPLRDGEAIRYEFYYDPDGVLAHPALDRLTFVLRPEGVALHWMTDRQRGDATGLSADNLLEDPQAQRGPRPLPLKERDWNAAELRLAGGEVALSLNGVEVFRRALEIDNDRLFGFYHDKSATEAKVRNVVLSGDWPQRITEEMLVEASGGDRAALSAEELAARTEIIGDDQAGSDVRDVVLQGRALPSAERYEYFAGWVLPGGSKHGFRLFAEMPNEGDEPSGGASRDDRLLLSPLLELVEAARESGRLDELAQRIAAVEATEDVDRRARCAALICANAARGDGAAVKQGLAELEPLLEKLPVETPDYERWPELVAAYGALEIADGAAAAQDLLAALRTFQDRKARERETQEMNQNYYGRSETRLQSHISDQPVDAIVLHLQGLARAKTTPRALLRRGASPLEGWQAVSHGTAQTLGRNLPRALWLLADGVLTHLPGHHDDCLYLDAPLTGDFTLEYDVRSTEREIHVEWGGVGVEISADGAQAQVFSDGRRTFTHKLDPPLAGVEGWDSLRLSVADGVWRLTSGERLLHEEPLRPAAPPWLIVRSRRWSVGSLRNLRCQAKPETLQHVDLSGQADLTGWNGDYAHAPYCQWTKRGEEILGSVERDYARGGALRFENVLYYERPLPERCRVSYEFYYQPGRTIAYPALDRLVLLLKPEGVSEHRLTRTDDEQSGLSPDNTRVRDECRLTKEPLPLVEQNWNRVVLELQGREALLTLNDKPIYRAELEADKAPQFGLFHYIEETQARVRRVALDGAWPALPTNLMQPVAAER